MVRRPQTPDARAGPPGARLAKAAVARDMRITRVPAGESLFALAILSGVRDPSRIAMMRLPPAEVAWTSVNGSERIVSGLPD